MVKKVVAFLGDFYHPRVPLEQAVEAATRSIQGTELIFKTPTAKNMSAALSEKPDMIILGSDNKINPEGAVVNCWLTKEADGQLESYVAKGGSLIILHSGLASYPADSKYRSMIKGEFLSHPPQGDVSYFSVKDQSPFNENSDYNYTVLDEFYVVAVDEEETNVFLYSKSEEHGKGFAGWYHTYGQGKVMCLVPTHNEVGLMHEETLRLYRSAFEWGLS